MMSDRKPREILEPACAAFGVTSADFLTNVAAWAEASGRTGHSNPKTLNEYGGHAKRVSLSFMLVVNEYLHANPAIVKNKEKLLEAQAVCLDWFKRDDSRLHRYDRPLPSMPDSKIDIDACEGIYIICRRETSTKEFCQDLMILRGVGATKTVKQKKRVNLATYVGTETVYRGHWAVLGNTLFADTLGARKGRKPDFIVLNLAIDDRDPPMRTGLLLGLTTAGGRDPVSMQVVAIKISDAGAAMLALGDLSDEEILLQLEPLRKIPEEKLKILREFKNHFEPVEIDVKQSIIAELTQAASNDVTQLIGKELLDFCRRNVAL